MRPNIHLWDNKSFSYLITSQVVDLLSVSELLTWNLQFHENWSANIFITDVSKLIRGLTRQFPENNDKIFYL
jgi:hypothetical protein